MLARLIGVSLGALLVALGALACTSGGSTPTAKNDAGDGGGAQPDGDAADDVASDCGLQGRACSQCISERCCELEHFCTATDPQCVAYGKCISECSLDAAACNCYSNFADLVAKDKARGQCEMTQCLEAGLCN